MDDDVESGRPSLGRLRGFWGRRGMAVKEAASYKGT